MLVSANFVSVVGMERGWARGVAAFRGRRDMYTRRRMGGI